MKQKVIRKDSIYWRLLRLLVAAAVVSVLFFAGLNRIGEYLINYYYYSTDYEEKKDQGYVNRLQKYVEQNQLSTRDSAALSAWVKEQKILSVQIFKDNILMYDSDYADQENIWEEEIEINLYDWMVYYPVQFVDGEALVVLYGMYSYQYYTYAMIAELLLAFALFLLIVMLGIRRTMDYIRRLCDEIEILEGGNLEYEITVSGKDELATLARSLDNMRKSFLAQTEKETYLVQANQRMVTNMSHDLRTPLTSIMIYTEILKKNKYKDERQMKEYLEKIEEKTYRMKQLSDRLFEYSLVTSEPEVELEEPEVLKGVFYDLLSETCAYLEQSGFSVLLEVEWRDRKIQVNSEYLMRIIDNITSNLVKYADPSSPVKIRSVYTEQEAGFAFENVRQVLKKKEDSNRIGIRNIKNMMGSMNGSCNTKEQDNWFCIILKFPSQ